MEISINCHSSIRIASDRILYFDPFQIEEESHDADIIFITHDMHLAIEYTDRAIVFADGQCIADDSVFKVLSDESVIDRANLKQTSLVTLAKACDIEPQHFIHYFIDTERRGKADE